MKKKYVIRRIFDEDESVVANLAYKEVFLADCHGIILSNRGKGDPHVLFQFISEDDRYWFPSDGSSSSGWLGEIEILAQYVQKWLRKNAVPDFGNQGKKKIQCGWKFKE